MLRLKGQTESGEWMEFGINLVLGVNSLADRWFIGIKGKIVKILIETIRPADDPRKQMLEEIRQQINGLPGTDYSCAGDTVYIHQEVNRKRVSEIIDETEAKL